MTDHTGEPRAYLLAYTVDPDDPEARCPGSFAHPHSSGRFAVFVVQPTQDGEGDHFRLMKGANGPRRP
jgi:hypothetical protein